MDIVDSGSSNWSACPSRCCTKIHDFLHFEHKDIPYKTVVAWVGCTQLLEHRPEGHCNNSLNSGSNLVALHTAANSTAQYLNASILRADDIDLTAGHNDSVTVANHSELPALAVADRRFEDRERFELLASDHIDAETR